MLQIIKDFIKKFLYVSNYKKYIRSCKKKGQKQYILFGTPKHGNIGDHAITLSIYQFFKDLGESLFEVSSFDRKYILNYIVNHISLDDIIMINGGGFMGSQWIEEERMIRDVFLHFPNHKIVIFPQTIYYKEDTNGIEEMNTSLEIYNAHKDLVVCTREMTSYQFACQNFVHAKNLYIPDMVLYFNNFHLSNDRKNVLFCLRSDAEKSVPNTVIESMRTIFKEKNKCVDETDTVISNGISKKERESIFYNKLLEFSKYEIIVTDRLHGMIFAALTGTPCIVLSNYNYKVKGVYQWIKDVEYIRFIEDYNMLEDTIEELLSKNYQEMERLCDKKAFEELVTLFRR